MSDYTKKTNGITVTNKFLNSDGSKKTTLDAMIDSRATPTSSSSGLQNTGAINVNVDKRFQAPTPSTTSGAKTTSTGATSGSASGSSSSSSSSNDKGSYGAYMQLAVAQMASNQARAEAALAAQKAAAQEAYDRGMNYLNSAYNSQKSSLGSNYDSTIGQLTDSYNRSNTNVNNDANRSLRQAYINKMINEKNLAQQMSAQGLSGGASESTLAKLYNNYGNSRNNIENTRANNLSDLEQTLNTNKASALQTYNNALADLENRRMQYAMSLEDALANNQVSATQNYQNALTSNNDSYLSALGNALDQMNKYNFTPSEVTNDIALANVIQNAYDTSSNYNKILNNALQENGVTTSALQQSANNNNYLAALLKGLYNA